MRFTAFFVIFLLLSHSTFVNSISLKEICDQLGFSDSQCCLADKTLKAVGYGGLAAAASTYGIPFVLTQLGFSATGIIGGSLAAMWQSTGIATGVFSAIQSTAVTGTAAAIVTKISAALAGFAGYNMPCNTKSASDTEYCKKNQEC